MASYRCPIIVSHLLFLDRFKEAAENAPLGVGLAVLEEVDEVYCGP